MYHLSLYNLSLYLPISIYLFIYLPNVVHIYMTYPISFFIYIYLSYLFISIIILSIYIFIILPIFLFTSTSISIYLLYVYPFSMYTSHLSEQMQRPCRDDDRLCDTLYAETADVTITPQMQFESKPGPSRISINNPYVAYLNGCCPWCHH